MMANIKDPYRMHPSVTDLIYCLTKTFMDSEQEEVQHSRQTKLFFTTGLALEQTLLTNRRTTLASGQLEGIYYHIDSLDHTNMIEFKSTRIKAGTEPDKLSYHKQIMAYLKTQGQTKVSLVILHVIQPELIAWNIEYTQEEIDSNWAWLQQRKDEWLVFKALGEVPTPYTFNQNWECRRCNYKFYCTAYKTIQVK